MFLDIKNIKIYLISPAENKYRQRLLTVFERLIDYGFKNVIFFKSIPGINNTASLTNTVKSIFTEELKNDTPFIILEDDSAFLHKYESIEIPDNLDMLYLGVSLWSYPYPVDTLTLSCRPNIVQNSTATIKSFDSNLTEVNGMTGAHAILYSSREFMRIFINKIDTISKVIPDLPHDLLFSALHNSFNVYALKNPMFYQDASLGGQEAVTKLYFNGECYR
jgi:hypothetical protein